MLFVSSSVELFGDLAVLDLITAEHAFKSVEESLDGVDDADAGVNDKGRDDQPRPFH